MFKQTTLGITVALSLTALVVAGCIGIEALNSSDTDASIRLRCNRRGARLRAWPNR